MEEPLTLFGRYAHHSNGQDSSFYLGNGEINLLSGDFATNYAEGGMILSRKMTSLNAYRFFSSSRKYILNQRWLMS
ncbi:MAG: hypothetical protein R2758_02220 [Bacteroidales bacterium]